MHNVYKPFGNESVDDVAVTLYETSIKNNMNVSTYDDTETAQYFVHLQFKKMTDTISSMLSDNVQGLVSIEKDKLATIVNQSIKSQAYYSIKEHITSAKVKASQLIQITLDILSKIYKSILIEAKKFSEQSKHALFYKNDEVRLNKGMFFTIAELGYNFNYNIDLQSTTDEDYVLVI